MRPKTATLIASLIFATSARAQTTAFNLTSAGCHDVSSYNACTISAAAVVEPCLAAARRADSEMGLIACGCEYYIKMMNCYMASCWNRVYEYEYQTYNVQYISECPNNSTTTGLPFFPVPDGAPDSCSCNLGKLYWAVNGSEVEAATCVTDIGKTALNDTNSDPVTIEDEETACVCCGESGAISSFHNICPDTNPALVGIEKVYSYIADVGDTWPGCSPFMNAYDCTKDLNFTTDAAGGGAFFTPDDLPASGTATLSNAAGTVSAPPSGTLFSYTNYYDSTVYTITAVVGGQTSGVATGSGSGSGGASRSASGPQSTSKTGAGGVWKGNWRFAAAVALGGAVVLL